MSTSIQSLCRAVIVLLAVAAMTWVGCAQRRPFSPAELDQRDNQGMTLLHVAVKDGSAREVRQLLEQGARVEARDPYDRTPLHWAAILDRPELAQLLVEHGADVSARAWYNMTPLHWAALAGSSGMVDFLLDHRAQIDSRNLYGMTALHEAATAAIVKRLVASGANVNARDDRGMTPLHTAYTEAVAQALVEAGAQVFSRAKNGEVAVHMLVSRDEKQRRVVSFMASEVVRVRNGTALVKLTSRNITAEPVHGLAVHCDNPHFTIAAVPESWPTLHPAQMMAFSVTFTANDQPHADIEPAVLTVLDDREQVVAHFEVRLDSTRGLTPEDRGMIRVASVNVRPKPGPLQILAYLGGPLVIVGIYLLSRWRRRRAARSD